MSEFKGHIFIGMLMLCNNNNPGFLPWDPALAFVHDLYHSNIKKAKTRHTKTYSELIGQSFGSKENCTFKSTEGKVK